MYLAGDYGDISYMINFMHTCLHMIIFCTVISLDFGEIKSRGKHL